MNKQPTEAQKVGINEYENLKNTILTLFKGKEYEYAISILENVRQRLEYNMRNEIIK